MSFRSLGILLVAVYGSAMAADPFQNGSFELGNFSGGSYEMLGTGSTAITGWVVSQGPMYWFQSPYPTEDGNFSVESYSGSCSISQTFATVGGATYDISFYGLSDNAFTQQELVSFTNNSNVQSSLVFLPGSDVQPGFARYDLSFTTAAGTTESTLTFAANAGDPYLDNVSVHARTLTPEPITSGLGLAGAVLFLRRRRKPART